MMRGALVADLIGQTFAQVTATIGGDELILRRADGCCFVFRHVQDCCESVVIEDICGDLQDLIGAPLLQAEEVTGDGSSLSYPGADVPDSFSWTFYKFTTMRGTVTVRWLGSSNGYYSEGVDFFFDREGEA